MVDVQTSPTVQFVIHQFQNPHPLHLASTAEQAGDIGALAHAQEEGAPGLFRLAGKQLQKHLDGVALLRHLLPPLLGSLFLYVM